MNHFTLTSPQRTLVLDTPKVMGILNTTPDSFSDGGHYRSLDIALKHVESMIHAGADIIDIGGESTRPGANEVSLDEELSRTIPFIEAIRSRFDIWISIDTSKAVVMTEAATAGVDMINDVRSLQLPGAREAAASTNLPICLMHRKGEPAFMQDEPTYLDVVQEVKAFLVHEIAQAKKAGIKKDQLIIDLGFGFGKTHEHNYTLLNHLDTFHDLGFPILTGMSRKRMLQYAIEKFVPNNSAEQRIFASVGAAMIAAMKGSQIIRVHDVAATVQALSILNSMHTLSK